MNIQEDYVSFEIAKLLKEKGFNEECCRFWQYDKANNKDDTDGISLSECNVYLPLCNSKIDYLFRDKLMSSSYSAPTLQMAMKWLRKVHNLFIEPTVGENDGKFWYDFDVIPVNGKNIEWDDYENIPTEEYSSPEKACEAAIKYCLEHLI